MTKAIPRGTQRQGKKSPPHDIAVGLDFRRLSGLVGSCTRLFGCYDGTRSQLSFERCDLLILVGHNTPDLNELFAERFKTRLYRRQICHIAIGDRILGWRRRRGTSRQHRRRTINRDDALSATGNLHVLFG